MGKPVITKTKTTVYTIAHVLIDMLTFNESYRRIRTNFKYQGFNCYSCRKKFQDGEKISVIFTDKGNKTVCHECGLNYQRELAEGQAHD